MLEGAELLELFRLLKRRRLKARKLQEKVALVAVNPEMLERLRLKVEG